MTTLLSIITLPGDAVSSTLAYTGTIFSDLAPIILLLIGISLALIVLEVIVGIFRK